MIIEVENIINHNLLSDFDYSSGTPMIVVCLAARTTRPQQSLHQENSVNSALQRSKSGLINLNKRG